MDQPDITRLRITRPAVGTASPNPKGRQRLLPYYLLAAIVVVASVPAYRWLTGRVVEVRAGTVVLLYPSQLHTVLTATGYVVPQTRADVASKATGRLEHMEVAEGDRVVKGTILARIEHADIQASLLRAEADLQAARTTLVSRMADLREAGRALTRADSLIQRQFLAPAAHDAEQARHERAQAAVANAKALIQAAEAARQSQQVALEYTLIRAPFDGVILSKNADVGDMLAPFGSTGLSKGSVVSMADLDSLQVEADVSESNLLKVYPGQPCEVQLDALPDERFACQVGSIVPTLDKSKATILVKTRFLQKDSRFLPDMSARVAFLSKTLTPEQQTARLAVPAGAIQSAPGMDRVFRVAGDAVKAITVHSGERLGDYTAVDPVLSVGDAVVIDPPAHLAEGSAVRVIKP